MTEIEIVTTYEAPFEDTRDLRPVNDIYPLPDNPRHGDVGAISESLRRFGQQKPIVVNSEGVILAGNHTYHAAVALEWTEIWVVESELEGNEQTGFSLADNRLSDLATYDTHILVDQLSALDDLAGTGYDAEDLDVLVAQMDHYDDEPETEPKISQIDQDVSDGDVWHLGDHLLIVGDCRTSEAWQAIGESNLVFTSPPYASQRDYTEEFTAIPEDEYVAWWEPLQALVADHLADDGSFFVNIKPPGRDLDTDLYVFDLVIAHVREWGWHFATEFSWERTGVPKQPAMRFKNQFEPVYQFTKGRWKFRPDNVRHYSENIPIAGGEGVGETNWEGSQGQPGATFFGAEMKTRGQNSPRMGDTQGLRGYTAGEYITEGLAYPGNRLPTFSGTHEAVGHPAAFPVGLPQFFIEAYTDPGDVIVDPFVGSGSTILAAEASGRVAFGIEISAEYANQSINRWNAHYPDNLATRP